MVGVRQGQSRVEFIGVSCLFKVDISVIVLPPYSAVLLGKLNFKKVSFHVMLGLVHPRDAPWISLHTVSARSLQNIS